MLLQVCDINIGPSLSWDDIRDRPVVLPGDCSRVRNLRVRPEGRLYLSKFDSDTVNLYLSIGTTSEIDYSVIITVSQVTSVVIALWLGSVAGADRKALGGSNRIVNVATGHLSPEDTDFADFPVRKLSPIFIQDEYFSARHLPSDRDNLGDGNRYVCHGYADRAFGRAVAIEQHPYTARRQEPCCYIRGQHLSTDY